MAEQQFLGNLTRLFLLTRAGGSGPNRASLAGNLPEVQSNLLGYSWSRRAL